MSGLMDKDWTVLFPEGRLLFYEGDDPDGFVKEMKEKFNFDPSADDNWIPEEEWMDHCFWCPPELLNKIYNGQYPLGS